MQNAITIFVLILFSALFLSIRQPAGISWEKLDEGLHYAEYIFPKKSAISNNRISILKVDPAQYKLSLFTAKRKGEEVKTAKEWGDEKRQVAIFNAGMYLMDFATNAGFMSDYGFVNNGKMNKDNTVMAFNRKDESVPHFQISDKTYQNWDSLKIKYESFSQSIRMVDCQQKNRWSQQNKKWSMVVIGKDKDGNALFIFTRSPYTVHDFVNTLLSSELNIYTLMYLEGGPEASFYLNHPKKQVARMGSYETDFMENDNNHRFWQIPNVIGIERR
ncbi:MAG: hypothetical protein ACI81T_000739 [Bacteroidia bacterium]|jgi:uncharacterized protein YigE (DUF2233 family)